MMVAPQNGAQRPQVLPGFEHITRSWDATLGICGPSLDRVGFKILNSFDCL